MRWRNRVPGIFLSITSLLPVAVFAVSVAERSQDNSVQAELKTFELAGGYEVNLFASEDDGIANPIAIRWDAAGRLWVLTTLAYAQVEPGARPNDQLLILEDRNRDGRVDTTSIWAEGLNMPTGFALGHGGVYLAEGESLVFLEDRDGDGLADTRRTVLSGFGTGDTHQNINSLSWGPMGDLWFSQGLHNFSRVETPWGIVRGEEAGFWRLDVKNLRLQPYCMHSMASQNPWGIGWDTDGNLFVKSNNRELGYIAPGIIPTDHVENLMKRATVAVTPGKSMGCEFVDSSHLPDLANHVLIAGYFASRVTAFPLEEEGAGFRQTEGFELLVSTHPSFRPVEVKVGPDGAIYVADWFNPIIGHYQASLRHPDRDRTHGRIWRITRKGQALVNAPDLASASPEELHGHLASPERWIRDQAARRIRDGDPAAKARILYERAAPSPRQRREAVQLLLQLETALPPDEPIDMLLLPENPLPLRLTGARAIGRFRDRVRNPLSLLETAIADQHPRVRLEAIASASHLESPDAMRLALRALDHPMDRFLDYSLRQTVHALAPQWIPALRSGKPVFDSPRHLAFAASVRGGPEANALLTAAVTDAEGDTRRALILALAEVGGPQALRLALEEAPSDLEVLQALHQSRMSREVIPTGPLAPLLQPALTSADDAIRVAGLHLAGAWKTRALASPIEKMMREEATPLPVRTAALRAWALITGTEAVTTLKAFALPPAPRELRIAACEALAAIDLSQAATLGVDLFAGITEDEASSLLAAFLSRDAGAPHLAEALEGTGLSAETATLLSRILSRSGRSDPALLAVVNRALGASAVTPRPHDPGRVSALVEAVRQGGDARRGKEIYESPLLNCVACHAIDGAGGVLGPNLDTVGSGLPLDLIIESVLYPERQIKEGYFSITVTTKDGRLLQGYREREEHGTLWIRNALTGTTDPVPLNHIRTRNEVGTLMPPGLTANLAEKELRDLIRYLWELRG